MSLTNFESRINQNIQRLIIHKTTYKVNVLTKILNISDTAHCQVCSYFCISQVKTLIADAVCSILIPNAMRQVHFYLLCEKCC